LTVVAAAFHIPAFLPHGYCFLWQPRLLWLHVIADGVIAAAYFSIPITLISLMRNRAASAYNWVLALFSTFIILCGSTHVMDIIDIWAPLYWIAGWIKAATAVVSIATAISIVPVIPRLVRLPNPRTDVLTQLPNRLCFIERATKSLERAKRENRRCALLFIDLDGFKSVNDSYDHATGDALLVAVAGRLLRVVRANDTVGRMSGDEFVICIDGIDSAETALRTAERVIADLGRPFVLANRPPITVGASVGIALSDVRAGGSQVDELLAVADRAMYRAKTRRRGTFSLDEGHSASAQMHA
jgi:diguanylate cyclase (GGDEF)-like protein